MSANDPIKVPFNRIIKSETKDREWPNCCVCDAKMLNFDGMKLDSGSFLCQSCMEVRCNQFSRLVTSLDVLRGMKQVIEGPLLDGPELDEVNKILTEILYKEGEGNE